MILIDALHLKSLGGLNILNRILAELNKKEIHLIIDASLKDKKLISKEYTSTYLQSSHFNRYRFYKRNHKNFDKFFCLANLPPPIQIIDKPVYIYFHNLLLLDSSSKNTRLKDYFKNKLKFFYITRFTKKNYVFVVQTQKVKKTLGRKIKNNINIFPIFEFVKKRDSQKENSKLIYLNLSNNLKHKNNENLINAFKKVNFKREILMINSFEGSDFKAKNLEIKFIGSILDSDYKSKLLSEADFLVNLSLCESFGLTIVEAIQYNCKVICSKIDTFKEIVETEFFVDPYSISDICKVLSDTSQKKEFNRPKLLIKDQTKEFVELLKV